MKLPKHIALSINHNEHNSYYRTIVEYFDIYPHLKDVNEEDKNKCIESDSIWEVVWYPDTPIGSYHVAASTLERALELANEIDEAS